MTVCAVSRTTGAGRAALDSFEGGVRILAAHVALSLLSSTLIVAAGYIGRCLLLACLFADSLYCSTPRVSVSPVMSVVDKGGSAGGHLWSQAQEMSAHWLRKGDSRVREWPLMNPYHMAAVVVAYLVLIPALAAIMKQRAKPVNVRLFATLHNINLTLLSLYMFVEVVRQAVTHRYSLFGNGVESGSAGFGMARILYVFYLSKTLEFIDTVIMCLKQNYRQITFLHVYHHASIFVIWWVIVYFAPGGEAYFSAALNSLVHVVMYGYYLWASYAPKLKEGQRPHILHPARYKQYITSMQLSQFVAMFVQACYDLLAPNPYPRFCVWILFFYMMTMIALFANFFVQSYIKRGGQARDRTTRTKKAE